MGCYGRGNGQANRQGWGEVRNGVDKKMWDGDWAGK